MQIRSARFRGQARNTGGYGFRKRARAAEESHELREDGGKELREDNSDELRE